MNIQIQHPRLFAFSTVSGRFQGLTEIESGPSWALQGHLQKEQLRRRRACNAQWQQGSVRHGATASLSLSPRSCRAPEKRKWSKIAKVPGSTKIVCVVLYSPKMSPMDPLTFQCFKFPWLIFQSSRNRWKLEALENEEILRPVQSWRGYQVCPFKNCSMLR